MKTKAKKTSLTGTKIDKVFKRIPCPDCHGGAGECVTCDDVGSIVDPDFVDYLDVNVTDRERYCIALTCESLVMAMGDVLKDKDEDIRTAVGLLLKYRGNVSPDGVTMTQAGWKKWRKSFLKAKHLGPFCRM